MNIAGLTQRMVERPESAGPSMPADLRIPRIALPHDDHRGTSLAKLGAPHAVGSDGAEQDMDAFMDVVRDRFGEVYERAPVEVAPEELEARVGGPAASAALR